MKVKMMNFAALGTPIVTTTEGAAEYPAGIAVVEDDISKFPQVVKSLLSNEEKYQKQSITARKIVEDTFSWDSVVTQVVSVYKKIKFHPKKENLDQKIQDRTKKNPVVYYQQPVPYPIWLEDEARAITHNEGQAQYEFFKGISK